MEQLENEHDEVVAPVEAAAPLSIKGILMKDTSSLQADVEFQYGIVFGLNYLARETLQKLARECTVYKYNPQTKVREPQLDSSKLIGRFCSIAVFSWKGMTPRALSRLLPIDFSKITEKQKDEEIAFSQEQLCAIVQASSEIDVFLQNTTTDINFFNTNLEHELGNSFASQSGN